MIKINILFTTSKLLAYLILIIGAAYAFIFKDSYVMISAFAAASAVIALKTYTTGQVEQTNRMWPKQEGETS